MNTNQKALVLGATGGVGGEVARLLVQRGWQVIALTRNEKAMSEQPDGINWVAGDAMNQRQVIDAAAGTSLIVHAVNPPGYLDWEKLVLPMIDNTIVAARQAGARVLLPGTVYNYGPDVFPDLDEASAQFPISKKGKIRAELERRLEKASRNGVPALIVRAGDFFGPRVANSWFSQGLVTPGKAISSIQYPGQQGIGHQWAYLPDVAETMVRLVEHADKLKNFETFHMQGHWDADGTQIAAAIARAAGKPELKASGFPWMVLRVLALFKPTLKELFELRYLWKTPLRMHNAKLLKVLGEEPHTPLDRAIQVTLQGLKCI
ncbi:MAG: NAD(P)H-binding protein [Undibacterium sp.]|nr:NAD(P)H-binding protein [Undibacterium sp.]